MVLFESQSSGHQSMLENKTSITTLHKTSVQSLACKHEAQSIVNMKHY